jgi:drug/metabolite transporter (DMT)-like permease
LTAGRASPALLGAGLVALAAACFGTLGPLTLYADEAGVSSLALVTWRAGLGAGFVLAILIARSALSGMRPRLPSLAAIPVRDRWFLGAASMANMILNLAVFVAFLRIGIPLALLLFYLFPAFVALASVTWFGDRLDRLRWLALGVSLVGVVLVVADASAMGRLDALGIGLSLAGSLAQTFYVLAARHGFARVPAADAAFLTMAGAALLYLALGLALGELASLGRPLSGWPAAWPTFAAGLIGAGVPTLCFITGIRLLGPPRAAILATLEPVVGVGLAAVLFGRPPTVAQLAGGALIIVAGVMLQLRSTRGAADHEAVSG